MEGGVGGGRHHGKEFILPFLLLIARFYLLTSKLVVAMSIVVNTRERTRRTILQNSSVYLHTNTSCPVYVSGSNTCINGKIIDKE